MNACIQLLRRVLIHLDFGGKRTDNRNVSSLGIRIFFPQTPLACPFSQPSAAPCWRLVHVTSATRFLWLQIAPFLFYKNPLLPPGWNINHSSKTPYLGLCFLPSEMTRHSCHLPACSSHYNSPRAHHSYLSSHSFCTVVSLEHVLLFLTITTKLCLFPKQHPCHIITVSSQRQAQPVLAQ